MAKLVANRYAEALFSIAIEEDKLSEYENEIQFIYDAFATDKEFLDIINHPQVAFSEKISIMENSFKDHVADDIIGLFALVFQKNREADIMNILQRFLTKTKEHNRIVTATVISAVALNEKQIDQIQKNLSKKLDKQVEIQTSVDQTLIGGLKVHVDGKIIDSTISYHLLDLKKILLDVQFVS